VGCGKCAAACNIDAIEMASIDVPGSKEKKRPALDTSFCLGCGVCALKCTTGALKLVPREQRVLHPDTTFERVILQCLERGTLQNQLFDNPRSISHKFMRSFTGAVLKLSSVKKAAMSDMFRSSFLRAMTEGIKKKGNGWMTEI
jgi:ferredoxin